MSDFTFTFHFHALEMEMAPHPSVLARRIPGMGEPGGPPSMMLSTKKQEQVETFLKRIEESYLK